MLRFRFVPMVISILVSGAVLVSTAMGADPGRVFRAGAAAIDITPPVLPVRIAGGFYEHKVGEVKDRLHARCLVLDDGRERIALVIIDNCVISSDILNKAKQIARESTGIAVDRMLMAADHIHSGPAVDDLLGSAGNPEYAQWLPGKIAEAVRTAADHLAPARIGWTVVQDAENTHCRQWIYRPDRIATDPFGHQTCRSKMHPGFQNPDFLGPAGPADPDLSLVSVQSLQGKPMALLGNYSMHYVGAQPISAEYFGAFCEKVAKKLAGAQGMPPFVGIMSNGTSGDLHWMDYSKPQPQPRPTHISFAEVIANQAIEACKKIEYHDWVPIKMRETTLTLKPRPIRGEDLANARRLYDTLKGRPPKTLPEVYALQQVALEERPSTYALKLQALNIGGLGIAAIPCEVFGITGLEIKACSPLKPTFTIELANGYNGYIPPPAQHPLGGYTTWRATSAYLEVQAAPKITEAILALLEEVSGQSRRTPTSADFPFGDYPGTVLASKPLAYWRLNEFNETRAVDESGNKHDGSFEPGVAFYLEGPGVPATDDLKRRNRAPQFAGGRMKAHMAGLGENYSVELWFSNYLPTDARAITGCLFAQGAAGKMSGLGLAGQGEHAGQLYFSSGEKGGRVLFGKTALGVKTWNHVVMVREGRKLAVYLNGQPTADITEHAPVITDRRNVYIGGGEDRSATFEGRIDEVAIYDRALSVDELVNHYQAARIEK